MTTARGYGARRTPKPRRVKRTPACTLEVSGPTLLERLRLPFHGRGATLALRGFGFAAGGNGLLDRGRCRSDLVPRRSKKEHSGLSQLGFRGATDEER